jgi:hypothetical protein
MAAAHRQRFIDATQRDGQVAPVVPADGFDMCQCHERPSVDSHEVSPELLLEGLEWLVDEVDPGAMMDRDVFLVRAKAPDIR